ncbi:MAG: hypothetical protein ACSLEY_03820 [Candidatus Saccharimonadales bacterium]
MDTVTYLEPVTQHWQLILTVVIAGIATYWLVRGISFITTRHYLKHRDMAWLELTPPASIARTPQATTELFTVLHGFYGSRSLTEKLLSRPIVMSFEVISTRGDGIRYLVQVEHRHLESLKQTVIAYLPQIKVSEVSIPEVQENM